MIAFDSPTALGLIELEDNNPLVCADHVDVPDAAATLTAVALGPLALTGMLVEDPVVQTNAPSALSEVPLEGLGSPLEAQLHHEGVNLGDVYSAQAMAVVSESVLLPDLRGLFAERYGRSFYVVESSEGNWDTSLVSGRPLAVYRLKLTGGDGASLVTVQVMADRRGKCGACQVVHTLNVMAGFEECLGIPEQLD